MKVFFLNLNYGIIRNVSGFFYVYKSLLCNSKQVNYLPIHVEKKKQTQKNAQHCLRTYLRKL